MLYNDSFTYSQIGIRYSGIQYTTVGIITSQSTEPQSNIITESNIVYTLPISEVIFSPVSPVGTNASESEIEFEASSGEISYIIGS